jgi:arylsulfatase A-like enzyme
VVLAVALVAVATTVAHRLRAPAAADGRMRNVLLISLDTLRADHLGAYGYGRPTSPTIDRMLAAEGVVFERAYTAFPATPASHMTIFTGLLPCAHGVYGGPSGKALATSIPTLPEVLQRAGYATGGFTEDAWVTAELGFSRGFDRFVENKSPHFNQPEGRAKTTFAGAADWIRAQTGHPWFAFVHTYQVHHPYTPPPGYVERVAPNHGSDRMATAMARYDGEIRYTDDLLRGFLHAIAETGSLDRTIVIVLSDHGELFGEHGQTLHGFSLWEPLLHAVLVMRAPGLIPAGLRVPSNVGLIDVLPTILDLLGLPPLDGVQGRSLVPLLHGQTLPPTTLYSELPFAHLVATHDGTMKRLIDTTTGHARVFDLVADPGELHDLGSDHDIEANRRTLAAFERLCAAGRARSEAGTTPVLDPEVRAKLKALGYVP